MLGSTNLMDYCSGEVPAINHNEQRIVKARRTKSRAVALIGSPDLTTQIRDWKSKL
jgi:hypothetical protein